MYNECIITEEMGKKYAPKLFLLPYNSFAHRWANPGAD